MPSPLYKTLLGLKALWHRVIIFEALVCSNQKQSQERLHNVTLIEEEETMFSQPPCQIMHPLLSMSRGNTYPVVGEEKKSGAASPSKVPDLMVHQTQHIPMLHCPVSPDLFLHCLTLLWKLQQQPLLKVERQTLAHIGSIRHLGSIHIPVHNCALACSQDQRRKNLRTKIDIAMNTFFL